MNILLVTPFFPPQTGGVATYIEDIRRSLSGAGHRVVVLKPGHSDAISRSVAYDGLIHEFYMRSIWFPRHPFKGVFSTVAYFLPTMWRLSRFMSRHEIHVVCVEYPLPNMFYFPLLCRIHGVKMVVGLHGDDVLSLHLCAAIEQVTVRWLVRKADWILAHSKEFLARALSIVGGVDNHKTRSLPIGVDCGRLREQAVGRHNSDRIPKSPYILTVAKLFERKGLDILLKAVQILASERHGYQFVIVGDGPEEARLRSMAAALGVDENVTFYGEALVEDIPALMRACDFFVLPSRSEPFGIVLLEAMTFAKAVVATRVGGIPEIVTDGYNGLLVSSENAEQLADRMLQLIRNIPFRDRIGDNAKAYVEKHGDYRALVGSYEQFFAQVISAH